VEYGEDIIGKTPPQANKRGPLPRACFLGWFGWCGGLFENGII